MSVPRLPYYGPGSDAMTPPEVPGTGSGMPTGQDILNFLSGMFSGGGYLAPPGSAVIKPGPQKVTPAGPLPAAGDAAKAAGITADSIREAIVSGIKAFIPTAEQKRDLLVYGVAGLLIVIAAVAVLR